MSTLSRAERLRKAICGSCLIAAPALLLVGGLLHPEETTDPARQYEIVAASADRWELAHWLITASMLLMVGAVLGLAYCLGLGIPFVLVALGARWAMGATAFLRRHARTVTRVGGAVLVLDLDVGEHGRAARASTSGTCWYWGQRFPKRPTTSPISAPALRRS